MFKNVCALLLLISVTSYASEQDKAVCQSPHVNVHVDLPDSSLLCPQTITYQDTCSAHRVGDIQAKINEYRIENTKDHKCTWVLYEQSGSVQLAALKTLSVLIKKTPDDCSKVDTSIYLRAKRVYPAKLQSSL